MAELSENAKKIFALKYSTKKTKVWKETCQNIADFISNGEIPYGKTEEEIKEISNKFFESLYELHFLPGGRIIANAGTGIKNLANCFVLGIEDSRESIYNTLRDAAEVFAMGGGVGYSFSNVREEGADIKSTGGKASGPLSFMSLFDQTGEVIQQASRRGAQLASLNISHPSIENFIGFKSTLNPRNQRILEEYDRNLKNRVNGSLKDTKYEKVLEKTLLDDQLTHFNISVLLTDEFMQAAYDDKNWNLISPHSKEIIKTVKAKDLLFSMAKQAHASGDPGALFYSRINEDNLVPYLGDINASNPCGEVPLLEGESCILASINLHKMFDKKHKDIDWDLLKTTAKIGTRFLEDVTEVTESPLQYVNEKTKGLRRLGLGVLGFADLLVDMNIPYESAEAVELSRKLSWFIAFHAWETSFELAKERGHFSLYDKEKVNLKVIKKTLYENPYQSSIIPKEDLYNFGVRNVSVTSLAPTGSIALIGGVNGGIEPFYCLAYKRNITEGIGNISKDSLFEINPSLEEKMKEYGYSKDEILEIIKYATENGSLSDCKLVTKEIQKIFKTANEIHWKCHVDIQSAWQEYVSNAISKTINIPEKSTTEEVLEIYFYMWEKRLKGGTIYRNNSKSFQILEKPNAN